MFGMRGIGKTEEVRVGIRFTVVHPIAVWLKLTMNLAKLRELPGNRIPKLFQEWQHISISMHIYAAESCRGRPGHSSR